MNIHLIGDSLVQTKHPGHNRFYCAWGDWLKSFLSEKVSVYNYALGGESSRSFLNEGRFYDAGIFTTQMRPYNMGPALMRITEGDYVLIQFMCNDDDSGAMNFRRALKQVRLGKPDRNGIYPTIVPDEGMQISAEEFRLTGKKYCVNDEEYKILEEAHALCNNKLFPYDCDATFKGYLKFYIDKIREKGAFPILVTSPAKHIFTEGKIIPVKGFLGGSDEYNDFTYVEAMKQLGDEENVPVIDLFKYMKNIYEEIGEELSGYFHNISVSSDDIKQIDAAFLSEKVQNVDDWCSEYDERRKNNEFILVDNTHFNYFGAFVQAALIADALSSIKPLGDYIVKNAKEQSSVPEKLKNQIDIIKKHFKYINF